MEPGAKLALTNVLDLLLDAVCVVDADGRFVFVSAACERIFGYTPAEMVGRPMIELVAPEDRERTLRAAAEIMAGVPQPYFENRYIRKDGRVVPIMWSARWSEADQLRIAVARDITERKRAESVQAALYAISEAAHQAEDLLALFKRIHQIIGTLLPAANFFVALYDSKKDELSFPYFVDAYDQTPAPRKLDSGTLSGEVIRSGQALLITPDTRDSLSGLLQNIIGMDSLDWLGVPLSSHNGTIGALVVQSYSGDVRYTEKDRLLLQFVSAQVASAIERKQMETRLRHVARHDPLTELPNRELFHDRLQTALGNARRSGARLALLYVDLDKFKQVNDRFGHSAGDLLLQEVACRLRQCVRDSDTVGRVGGDEFVVLLNDIHLPEDAAAVAEKIRAALNRPFDLAGPSVHISPSIGIAVYPEHGDDKRPLLLQADEAMYQVKNRGGNGFLMAPEQRPAGDGN